MKEPKTNKYFGTEDFTASTIFLKIFKSILAMKIVLVAKEHAKENLSPYLLKQMIRKFSNHTK